MNIATDQTAWGSYTTSAPPLNMVDGNLETYGSSGDGQWPFVALDLENNVPVGSLTFLIKQGELLMLFALHYMKVICLNCFGLVIKLSKFAI